MAAHNLLLWCQFALLLTFSRRKLGGKLMDVNILYITSLVDRIVKMECYLHLNKYASFLLPPLKVLGLL